MADLLSETSPKFTFPTVQEVEEINRAMRNLLQQIEQLRIRVAIAVNDLPSATVPASAAAAGSPGQMAYESGFLYVCVATDTWERGVIATW